MSAMFAMTVTMRPHGGDLIRWIGYVSLETAVMLGRGEYPRGNIIELADVVARFRVGVPS